MPTEPIEYALDSRNHTRELRLVRVHGLYGNYFLGIHEVSFIDGKLNSVSRAVPYFCGSIEDMKQRYSNMKLAFVKPVIDEEQLRELSPKELEIFIKKDEEERIPH